MTAIYPTRPTGPAQLDEEIVGVTRSELSRLRQRIRAEIEGQLWAEIEGQIREETKVQLREEIAAELREAKREAAEARREWWKSEEERDGWRDRAKIAETLLEPLREKVARLEAELASARLAQTVIDLGSASRPMGGMMPVPTLLEQVPHGVISKSRVYELAKSGEITSCQSDDGRLYALPASFWAAVRKAAARKCLRLLERDGQLVAEPL
ncbi:Fe-S oxidoreductase [Bradyrhizobium japonicum]|jgi:hypothetical protein|uniref:hypothetical protein n=1 Tax=Bradyrhizobium elkanii TaxID=29448 RepID=UPI000367A0E4|nr:hypothetical protein [Bradyrhizobium elkanii]MBP2434762.1 Fe-S oxidoreductase [Bradyrhizobium elkanii]MCP1732002.1 Fe-S oxidoreductase [Bradyrhizobium elkanii]MCS3567336.1 Fe-S oxidoreductase [Bradyrhizobium elkanii]MCS3591179.1 Fe-S oxidoreductase [Bradyrhizobium elkanii]MCS3620622.1 Fe-S oxidoreductase [Bradyrhizobium elkanii]